METTTETLSNLARQLELTGLGSVIGDLLLTAGQKQISYVDFTMDLLSAEIDYRKQQNLVKRLRHAIFSAQHDLNLWQENHVSGISRTSSLTSDNASGWNNILISS